MLRRRRSLRCPPVPNSTPPTYLRRASGFGFQSLAADGRAASVAAVACIGTLCEEGLRSIRKGGVRGADDWPHSSCACVRYGRFGMSAYPRGRLCFPACTHGLSGNASCPRCGRGAIVASADAATPFGMFGTLARLLPSCCEEKGSPGCSQGCTRVHGYSEFFPPSDACRA